jgi:glycosyltransferase involved in cell wall biosynthesis
LDLHPEGLIALGLLKDNTWYVKLWIFFNHLSYNRAERLFVLGRDMIPLICEKYSQPKSKFHYLPHWSAVESADPISFENSMFTEKWNLQSKFVVQYSGNMGLWHDIDTFILAAKRLEVDPTIQFLFIGNGRQREKGKKLAQQINCKNIQWHDFVDLSELPSSLAACHLSLLSLKDGLEGVAVPCKFYGILSAGRAVVAQVPKDSEVALSIKEHQCGVVISPGDVNGLVEHIRMLSQEPSRVAEMGQNSFRAYEQFYRIDNAATSLIQAMKNNSQIE